MTTHDTRTGSETAIPADVMEAARRSYETPIREDGSSLVSIVNRMAEDDVKLAIASAIMAERERCALVAATPTPQSNEAGSELIDDLRKFFAQTVEWADENGWTDMACQYDRIVDWFGPSDFFEMRKLLDRLDDEYDNGVFVAAKIGDAVLTWLVKHGLADAENEYDADDITEILNDLAPAQQTTELDQINAMLSEGQGDDDGARILPDFPLGASVYAKVEACLQLLERRRDALASPSPQPRETNP